jgi:DNA adenine methylase
MEEFRHLGVMHRMRLDGRLKILENYIAPVDFSINDNPVKKGSWLMVIRVLDDKLWEGVKAGKLTGLSIGGSAVRTPDNEAA